MEDQKWHVKEEADTDPKYGSIPEKREIEQLLDNGIAIVDKPFGPQSNQVSTWLKKELNRKKTGHFGTLDPNATGVLPIGLNSGTRVSKTLSEASKEYIFEVELKDKRAGKEIRAKLSDFKGINKQVPPKKSAVKREERERKVFEIDLIEVKEKKFLGRVKSESGFYVRVLVSQIGEKLGTDAEMKELRRTEQGDIKEQEADTIQDIVDAYKFWRQDGDEKLIREKIFPKEKAVSHIKKIAVKDSAVNAVANGANLGSRGISKLQDNIREGERIAITTLKGELIAIAEAKMTSEQMFDKEGTAAELNSVHMDPKKYPKRWKQ